MRISRNDPTLAGKVLYRPAGLLTYEGSCYVMSAHRTPLQAGDFLLFREPAQISSEMLAGAGVRALVCECPDEDSYLENLALACAIPCMAAVEGLLLMFESGDRIALLLQDERVEKRIAAGR